MTERPFPLEITSDDIKRLKRDLRSEIVYQEEKSHIEPGHHVDQQYVDEWDPGRWIRDYKVIDKPRIARPDTHKRNSAKVDLIYIYNFSNSLRTRMQSGQALGISRLKILRTWLLE